MPGKFGSHPLPQMRKKAAPRTRTELKSVINRTIKSRSEMKQVNSTSFAGVLSSALPSFAFGLQGVAVDGTDGASDSSRVGNRIRLVRVEIRISFDSAPGNANDLALRLMLLKTEDDAWEDTASPLVTNHTLINTPLVDSYKKRLYDRTLLFTQGQVSAYTARQKYITISKKLNNVVHFKNNLANSYSQGIIPVLIGKLFDMQGGVVPAGNTIDVTLESSLYFKEE